MISLSLEGQTLLSVIERLTPIWVPVCSQKTTAAFGPAGSSASSGRLCYRCPSAGGSPLLGQQWEGESRSWRRRAAARQLEL